MLKRELEQIDSKSMFQTYDQWPDIAREAYFSEYEPLEYRRFDEVVFVGMGGSGAINECIAAILSKSNIHITLVKGYHLPKIVKNTLVVFTSVSGNTAETLSVLNSAASTDCQIIAFSSGGRMEDICKKNNLKFIKVPMQNSPRASFPAYFFCMLKVLKNYLDIRNEDVSEAIELLAKTKKNIFSDNLSSSNLSLRLANWLDGIPLIYYPWGLQVAATRFKNSLQENSKMHAMAEDVLEACHNGIVGWERQSNVKPVLIRGTDDFVKTREKYEIIKEYFNDNRIDFFEIFSEAGGMVGKLICLIYVLDYASIYKAVLKDIDPTPVRSIDYIKNKVKE